MSEPDVITEQWLRDIGFKFDEPFLKGQKHWTLWMGGAVMDDRRSYSSSDLGIELSNGQDGKTWGCWIRADYAGRYSRFVHIRRLRWQHELMDLIEAMTGFPFDAKNSMYGQYHKPEHAQLLRDDYANRLEVRMAEQWGQRAIQDSGQDPDGRDIVRP